MSAATVVILRAESPSAQAAEMLTLLHGELSSIALDNTTLERPATSSSGAADFRAWLEQLAAERGAFAILDMLGDERITAVDVWVRKSQGRFDVTRVAVDPGMMNNTSRLAIRAVEALRASLLESDLAHRYQRPAPVEKPGDASKGLLLQAREAIEVRQHVGFEAGASALVSPGGVGPAVLPLVRIDWAVRPSLLIQAAVAGLGSHAVVTNTSGKALVTREYVLLGGTYRFRTDRQSWWPWFSVAAGAQHTSVDGQSNVGMDAHAVDQWSMLVDAGLGLALHLSHSYQLTVSAHAQVMHPYLVIHFGDPVAATAGRPNLLLTLTVGAWL